MQRLWSLRCVLLSVEKSRRKIQKQGGRRNRESSFTVIKVSADEGTTLIKRVVATSGDMDDGGVFGQLLEESDTAALSKAQEYQRSEGTF